MLCGDLNGKEIQKRGDMCIHTADSFHCTVETNTTLLNNYTSIKKKKKGSRGFPGGPVVQTPSSQGRGPGAQFLIRELDLAYCN